VQDIPVEQNRSVEAACRAAIEVAANLGLAVDEVVVLQDTNNVVVWLRPHAIVAKVGRFAHSAEALSHERAVGQFLAASRAPVAEPLPGIPLLHHQGTGFVVTLWERLEVDPARTSTGTEVGRSLRVVHGALAKYDGALPSFRDGLAFTRAALADDARMAALPPPDRALLRSAFDELIAILDTRTFVQQALHGEPHDDNFVVTGRGVRWIDFENACMGPLE
jgi:Ser/Thr protein kinase RdoA (MazF antagonist)